MMISITDVLASYASFLSGQYPWHHAEFVKRRAADIEAAAVEAATFNWAYSQGLNPRPHEQPGIGGADFSCTGRDGTAFLLEATALLASTAEQHSGLPSDLPHGVGVFSASLTHPLRQKVASKAKQLAGAEMPTVLMIASTHNAAGVLLDTYTIECLLTSDVSMSVPVGGDWSETGLSTGLEKSIFFKYDSEGRVVSVRRTVSAVLVMAACGYKMLVGGVFHPDPLYVLPPESIPDVPMVSVDKWPLAGNQLAIHWNGDYSELMKYDYCSLA